MAARKDDRIRNFATVVYPESAPEHWLDSLSDLHIQAFVSPLHDQDMNPNGEPKKPHYHVMMMFEGKKSDDQIRDIISLIGGVGLERCNSIRGYARYLCHLDNPEKHRYNLEDVRCFGGADIYEIVNLVSDDLQVLRQILSFIEKFDYTSYSQLMLWCSENNDIWFRALAKSISYPVVQYLKSRLADRMRER